MAKFTYIGVDDAADQTGTDAFGLRFPLGQPVEVSDEWIIAKLSTHPHFAPAGETVAAMPIKRGPGRPRKSEG